MLTRTLTRTTMMPTVRRKANRAIGHYCNCVRHPLLD
jgi:hypothetical protein